MPLRMQRGDLIEMSRQIDAHLTRVHQFVQRTLQPYMEANGWSLLPPVVLRTFHYDENGPQVIARMFARPRQLREWADQFMYERDRLVQMTNRFPPRAIQMEGLRQRIYNMVTRLEQLSISYRQLATRLQANLIHLLNPAAAPPRQPQPQFEKFPDDYWDKIPEDAEEDNLDDDEDWSLTQSRRRGGI